VYLLANVLGYLAGLESPAADNRIGGIVESTGFVRIIFPLTGSINIPPVIAAVYITASIFMILESGWLLRSLRLICLVAAVIVLAGAGTRTPIAVAALLSISVIFFPFITRWMAQAATALAAVSAFTLPTMIGWIQSAIAPLVSLTPGRELAAAGINSLNGRDLIWVRSIKYWIERVNDLPNLIFGFGVNGHYRSGASLAFRERFASISRYPEISATMHNSFLQQLFDGGLLGCALLIAAAYWASTRLSNHRKDWGHRGSSAILAMTALLLSGMTEVSLAPGAAQETFWLLAILVGVACQASGSQAASSTSLVHRGQDGAAAQNAEHGYPLYRF
jgi:O-antigen ligase